MFPKWYTFNKLILIIFYFHYSTSFTTAAYGSHQNVFIRLDPLGRPPSANSGSYATIASLNKFPLTESKKSCKFFFLLFLFECKEKQFILLKGTVNHLHHHHMLPHYFLWDNKQQNLFTQNQSLFVLRGFHIMLHHN